MSDSTLDARIALRQRFAEIPRDGKGLVDSPSDSTWRNVYGDIQQVVLGASPGTEIALTTYVLADYVRVALTLARQMGIDLALDDRVSQEIRLLGLQRPWRGGPVFSTLPKDPTEPGVK